MRRLSIGIIDLVAKAPTPTLWMRVMGASFVSIMPQVVATWCEEPGHVVTLVTYTGRENLIEESQGTVGLVYINSLVKYGDGWRMIDHSGSFLNTKRLKSPNTSSTRFERILVPSGSGCPRAQFVTTRTPICRLNRMPLHPVVIW